MSGVFKLEIDYLQLARLIAAELAQMGTAPSRAPYHQGNLPPGETRRSYLDKARSGAIVASKTGRSVLCAVEDWDAYVTQHKRSPRPSAKPAANDVRRPTDRELLEGAGIRLRPPARRR